MISFVLNARVWARRSLLPVVAVVALAAPSVAVVTSADAALTAQKTLKISNAVHTAAVGSTVKVTTSGGSGTGKVTFLVKGTHCKIDAATGSLTAKSAATCVVTASKASSAGFKAATAAAVTFTFSVEQAPLKITNKTLAGSVGAPISVTFSGGSGSGVVTYMTTGSVCSINSSTGQLNAQAVGTCPVTVSKAASGIYPAATSAPVTFTFGIGTQAPLVISNTVLDGVVGTALAVVTTGGSGDGLVTFATSGDGCSIVSDTGALSDSAPGTCSVTATKAATANYKAATSSPVVFTFIASSGGGGGGSNVESPTYATPDIATLTSVTGTYGSQIDATADGDKYFIDKYYNSNDHWYINYMKSGAKVTLTWHVTGSYGQSLAYQPVTLYGNLNYSTAKGVTWDAASLNSYSTSGSANQGSLAGTTDVNGDVTFTLTNTNTQTGPAPTDYTTVGGAEGNEGPFRYTDMILGIGSDTYTSGTPNPSVDEQVDRVDFVLIPAGN